MGRVVEPVMHNFVPVSQVISALIDLKIIVPTADMLSIRRSMQFFLKNFQQATQREETIGVRLDTFFRFLAPLRPADPIDFLSASSAASRTPLAACCMQDRRDTGPMNGPPVTYWCPKAFHVPQAIGEDLFAIALDQPFRFPATFTFVLRAFSTLEGLGKVQCV